MAWCRPGDWPLSEPVIVNLLTYISVFRLQWFNEVIIWMIIHKIKIDKVLECILVHTKLYFLVFCSQVANNRFDAYMLHMLMIVWICYCYIYIPGKLGLCFRYWYAVDGVCKGSGKWWPAGRINLFVHYNISLPSLCRLMWKHRTSKNACRHMLSNMFLELINSLNYLLSNICGCVSSAYPIILWWPWDDHVYFILLSSYRHY